MALQALAIQAGIAFGLWGASKMVSWLSPSGRPLTKAPPKPLKLPRAGKGTVIPLVYGHVKIETPPIYWVGNELVQEATDTAGSYRRIDLLLGAGIPAARNIPGHDWYLLETPPRLMAVWIMGHRVELGSGAGLAHGESEEIFGDLGGRGAGGNYRVRVEFFDGRDGQDLATGTAYATALATANLGIPIDPGYVSGYARQMCVAILMSPGAYAPGFPLLDGVLGEGDSLVSIGLEVQALGTEAILTDGEYYEANPAMILLDLIAGDVWKLGYPLAQIDTDSFFDCGDVLVSEGFGMSGAFATRGQAPRLFSELLDTINGIIFKHHITGKLTLKLIRSVNPSGLPVVDFSNTVGDPEVQFIGWQDLVNQVDVEFLDRSLNWVTNLATAQRGASAVGQGGQTKSRKVQYPAITSAAVARRAAARELGVAARPLMTAKCRVNRTLHAVGHGDALMANWVNDDGPICTNKIFRVVDVDHGTPEDGTIGLELIEDVFDQTEGGLPPWPWGSDNPFEIPDEPEIEG